MRWRLWALAAAGAVGVVNGGDVECTGECTVEGHPSEAMMMIMESKIKAHRKFLKQSKMETRIRASNTRGISSIRKGRSYPCKYGRAGAYFPCKGTTLLSVTSRKELGVGDHFYMSDIWGWTDSSNGREYALTTSMDGSGIVDVTDPVKPKVLVRIDSLVPSNQYAYWRDVKTFNNTAYFVVDYLKHGMQVVDLERVRNIPTSARLPVNFGADFVYSQFTKAHNIFINEKSGYAYVVGSNTCNGGVHLLNLNEDRLKPKFAGCMSDGYVHDIVCETRSPSDPDPQFANREICFAFMEDHVGIYDFTDKAMNAVTKKLTRVVKLADTTYPGHKYVHQGWLTEDKKFLLIDDELDESAKSTKTKTYYYDVTSLRSPVFKGFYESPVAATDHNLYIKGDLAYMANYAAGLRVVTTAPLATGQPMREVAYFDVFPSKIASKWNGVWSSYIYFNSGSILLSSQEYGLIVVRVNNL